MDWLEAEPAWKRRINRWVHLRVGAVLLRAHNSHLPKDSRVHHQPEPEETDNFQNWSLRMPKQDKKAQERLDKIFRPDPSMQKSGPDCWRCVER